MVSSAKSKSIAALTPALQRALSRFLAWWSGELVAMVPVSVRRWWRESDRVVLLRFDEKRAVFERETDGRCEEILAVALESEDFATQRAEVGRELPRLMGQDFRLVLCLSPDKVLRRTVILPLAVEENLRQALTFELDRFTPFKPEQVYFDHHVVGRDPIQRRLTVNLAAVRQAVLDKEVARAVALGVRVSGATPADDAVEDQDHFNLLPESARAGKVSHRLWVRVGLGLVSSLLLATLLGVPIWQKRSAAISLLEPLAQANGAAMETDQLRDRLDKLVAEHNLLPDQKWQSPSPLLILDELSKRLTDETFVMFFEFDGKTVQIQGESGVASGLVEVLEASPMFKDVAFKAQLTKIQGTPVDHFQITATLEDGARPKPMPGEPTPGAPMPPSTEGGRNDSSPARTAGQP